MNAALPDCAALLETLAATAPDQRMTRLQSFGDPAEVLLALGDDRAARMRSRPSPVSVPNWEAFPRYDFLCSLALPRYEPTTLQIRT